MQKSELPGLNSQIVHQLTPEVRALNAVVVGNAGSGKSSAARAEVVEPILAAGRRCCIIDPTGIWWGLRFQADGSPGFKVAIIGGLYGDVELRDPDAIAQWVGEHDTPCIIDVSEILIGARHEFATRFFAALYRYNRRPLHLIVDEADEFAPQNPMPDTRKLLHQFDRIVRRGRVRGFRVVMITQRPAVLHKNVLSQANVLVAMRMLGSQDRDAIQLWIKGQGDIARGKEVLNTLPNLKTGEGWLWAPTASILQRGTFNLFKTFDSSRTPKDDEPAVEPPGPFPYEFPRLVQAIGDTDLAEEDQEEAPKSRGARQAGGKPAPAAEADLRKAREAGRREGFEQGHKAVSAAIEGKLHGLMKAADNFMVELAAVRKALAGAAVDQGQVFEAAVHQAITGWIETDSAPPEPKASAAARAREAIGMHPAANRLLTALARYSRHPLSWPQICIPAGIAHGNGYFYRGRKWIVEEGFAQEQGSQVQITAAGLKLIGGTKPPQSAQEVLDTWGAKLTAPGGQMLRFMVQSFPRRTNVTSAELSEGIGIAYGNGYWYRGVKSARDTGLLEQSGDSLTLSEFLRKTIEGKY